MLTVVTYGLFGFMLGYIVVQLEDDKSAGIGGRSAFSCIGGRSAFSGMGYSLLDNLSWLKALLLGTAEGTLIIIKHRDG